MMGVDSLPLSLFPCELGRGYVVLVGDVLVLCICDGVGSWVVECVVVIERVLDWLWGRVGGCELVVGGGRGVWVEPMLSVSSRGGGCGVTCVVLQVVRGGGWCWLEHGERW